MAMAPVNAKSKSVQSISNNSNISDDVTPLSAPSGIRAPMIDNVGNHLNSALVETPPNNLNQDGSLVENLPSKLNQDRSLVENLPSKLNQDRSLVENLPSKLNQDGSLVENPPDALNDKEYVVETQPRNLTPGPQNDSETPGDTSQGDPVPESKPIVDDQRFPVGEWHDEGDTKSARGDDALQERTLVDEQKHEDIEGVDDGDHENKEVTSDNDKDVGVEGDVKDVGVEVEDYKDVGNEGDVKDVGVEGEDNDVGDKGDDNDVGVEGEDDSDSDSSSSHNVSSFLARLDAEVDCSPEAEDADSENEGYYNPAVDRGYAWVICIAVFFIQLIYVGYLKCGGLLFVEFQKRFHSSSSMTSAIIGMQEGVCSISSFICIGFVLKKMTQRTMSLIGSVLFIFSVIGSAVVDRVEYLFVTYSLLFGIAIAATYAPSIVILNQYFVKRRALAVSLSTSGMSVGGIVLPLLLRRFFDEYEYTGGTLMTAGAAMHVMIAVTLLIPVNHHRRQKPRFESKSKSTSTRDVEEVGGNQTRKSKSRSLSQFLIQKLRPGRGENTDTFEAKRNGSVALLQQHRSCHNSNNSVHRIVTPNLNFDQSKMFHPGKGGLGLDTFNSRLEICEEGVPLKIDTPAYDNPGTPTTGPTLLSSVTDRNHLSSHGKLPIGFDTGSPFGSHSSQINGSYTSIHLYPDYNSRSRNFVHSIRSGLDTDSNFTTEGGNHAGRGHMKRFSSSRQTLSASFMFHSTTTLNTVADMVSNDVRLRSLMSDQAEKESKSSLGQKLRGAFNGNPLFRSLSFWLLTIFYFTGCIGHSVPQMYIPALAKERGLTDQDGAFFISILNILDIPSHLVPGILVTMGVAKATRICVLPMFIVGVVCQLTFLYDSYESLLAMSIVYGLFSGFYYAMQSVIIIETLGLEHFASTIGFYYLVMGFGAAISFPIAGALKDSTGSYSSSYHYLATVDFLATLTLFFLPLARKYDIRRGVLKEEED